MSDSRWVDCEEWKVKSGFRMRVKRAATHDLLLPPIFAHLFGHSQGLLDVQAQLARLAALGLAPDRFDRLADPIGVVSELHAERRNGGKRSGVLNGNDSAVE